MQVWKGLLMTRKEKIMEELARAKERRAALDAKIEELEQKLVEAENAEILGIVRDANLSAEELSRIMAYAQKAMASRKKEE